MNQSLIFVLAVALVSGSLDACFGENAATPAAASCARPRIRLAFRQSDASDCVMLQHQGKEGKAGLWWRYDRSGDKRLLYSLPYFSDERIERVNLSSYKNPAYHGPRSGDGVRLVFPEKSSVIFYWDDKKASVKEFWETD